MKRPYGYAGKIFRVDLTAGDTSFISTMEYADRFLGGSGIAAKIYWDEVPPAVGALTPENRIMFMNGPLAGFKGLGGSRWTVSAKCPNTVPEQFAVSNLGGSWGAQLKFAGYDGVVIQGRAEKPIYLFIDDDVVEIRDAADLWGKGTLETREILKERLGHTAAVVACGQAGENLVLFASILADNDASGSSGMGAVMGSKNLKAVVVRGSGTVSAASPEKLKEAAGYAHQLWKGLRILNDRRAELGKRTKDLCYGCFGRCPRAIRELEDGTRHRTMCGPPAVFHIFASLHYGDMEQMPAFEVPLRASRLLDDYGLDCHSMVNQLGWLLLGGKLGIFTDENTGLPLSEFGSLSFFEQLLRKISLREGFGDTLARGIWQAADSVGGKAKELLAHSPASPPGKDGRIAPYCPRAFPSHGLLWAMDPTLRIQQLHEMSYVLYRWLHWADDDLAAHVDITGAEGSHVDSEVFRNIARRFWGSEIAADFTTYEGKAEAAARTQNRSWIKESLIVCDYLFPILTTNLTDDHVGDPAVESRIFSAVTGREIDEEGMNRIGERIFNLRRAIALRERGGRESDTIPEYMFTTGLKENGDNPKCLAPGRDGEVISLLGTVVDREKFEKLKDEYYELRGWEVATGRPTRGKMEELDLKDVAASLERLGLLA